MVILSQENQEREPFSLLSPCPRCGSTSTRIGAGRKPQEVSRKCSQGKTFVGYIPLGKLTKAYKQKKLKRSLVLQEGQGFQSDAALFVLSKIGGENA